MVPEENIQDSNPVNRPTIDLKRSNHIIQYLQNNERMKALNYLRKHKFYKPNEQRLLWIAYEIQNSSYAQLFYSKWIPNLADLVAQAEKLIDLFLEEV